MKDKSTPGMISLQKAGDNIKEAVKRLNDLGISFEDIVKSRIPTTIKVIESADLSEVSLTQEGFMPTYTNVKYKLQGMNYKIAFTGSSGSGKTTLVEWLSKERNIPHISGSAGDVLKDLDKQMIQQAFDYYGDGHKDVIANSIANPGYGIINQLLLQMRRQEIIQSNDNFITDRSPVDNMTYFINQCGANGKVTNDLADEFFNNCVHAAQGLTHLIYIKAVQPIPVENNGSRIANNFYQKAIDAQFAYWLTRMMESTEIFPKVLVIDFWDLQQRKNYITNWLDGVNSGS